MNSTQDPDVLSSVYQIEQLLNTGILSLAGIESPFFRPCVTQTLIDLNDLLQRASQRGQRVSFRDDVHNGDAWDITDLVANCRNAACHISSKTHLLGEMKFTFSVVIGQQAVMLGNEVIGCEHADDAAIHFGRVRLLMNRNLVRAFEAVKKVFPPPWSRLQ